MAARELYSQLQQLHELILKERECAKAFDMESLTLVTRAKEELLFSLEGVEEATDEVRALAETIRTENRRNAYLFWSTLRFVRESMTFLNGQVTQTAYGAGGSMVNTGSSGMVLAGRA